MSDIYQYIAPCLDVPYVWRGRTPDEGLDCWGAVRLGLKLGWGIERSSYAVDVSALDPSDAIETMADGERQSGQWSELPCAVQPFRPSGPPQGGDVFVVRSGVLPLHLCLVVDRRYILHTQRGEYSRLIDWRRDPIGQWLYRIIEHWRPIELCQI